MSEPNAYPKNTEADLIELRILLATLQGELNKTPGRFEYFGTVLSVVALLTGIFAAAFFFIVDKSQRDFEAQIIRVIEAREAAQTQKFINLLDGVGGKFPQNR
ncbi:hypothetical protein NBRC116598_03300 [Pseudophaeobacter arcticus]|uniref:Uncharacterized protein n=1 Tax=Pseudophaeobacter arcticus TaxID=385492 RepID=A0ABQ0AG88_9RHOB